MHSISRARLLGVAGALGLLGCAMSATAQDNAIVGPEDAIHYFATLGSANSQAFPCASGDWASHHVQAIEAGEEALNVRCDDGSFNIPYVSANVWLDPQNPHTVCLAQERPICGRMMFSNASAAIHHYMFYDVPNPRDFAAAWNVMLHPPPGDPATDLDFQSSLRAERAAGVNHDEAMRRAAIQAESLIDTGRIEDAAAIYQSALQQSPSWATGHYNLALVDARLQRYSWAIAEMRRYLFLEPNGSDARAAQDQIYRWEAVANAHH